ncbi:perilipin-2-like isoform X3 [Lytechinus variegatus]|uniref:perilipin-2-like isoform X3 n=1 Tax=Lytechinus variegatus TaxID=7654 RepID=UPI001BB189AD|nr:perilipin-2-like isoform X3 [Lytechinus variegatus]
MARGRLARRLLDIKVIPLTGFISSEPGTGCHCTTHTSHEAQQQPPSMQPELENQTTGEGEDCGTQVNVINRMAALPVVSSTLSQVTNAYNWSKDKNSLVKYTLEMAESTVAMAASTAQPVVNRLEGPISAVNEYANQQMDKLEEKVPVITESPEKMMMNLQDGTKKMIENTKKAGSDRINNLLLTRLGKALTTGVDTALLLSEFAVDYYLPDENTANNGEVQVPDQALAAAGVEPEDHIPEDKPLEATVQKASRVSNKVRRRVVNKAMRNVRYAQKRSQETLDKLHFTVDLIEYARTNIDSANKAVQSRIDTTHQTLSKTWDDWTLEEESDAKKDVDAVNGEQKTLAIARNLAGRLQVLSGNIAGCVRLLPQNLRGKVEEGRELADALYNSLEEVQTIRDLPANVLVTAKQQLNKMSDISMSVADFLVSSTPLQWLVPDVDIDSIEFDNLAGSDEYDFDIRSDTSSDL